MGRVTCNKCGMPIPSTAKICPYCKTKQHHVRDSLLLMVILIIGAIILHALK